MNYPNQQFAMQQYSFPPFRNEDDRFFPIVPFLTGLAIGPVLYEAFHPESYYPYPPPPPPPYYYPYDYGYNPYNYNGYY